MTWRGAGYLTCKSGRGQLLCDASLTSPRRPSPSVRSRRRTCGEGRSGTPVAAEAGEYFVNVINYLIFIFCVLFSLFSPFFSLFFSPFFFLSFSFYFLGGFLNN